MKTCSARTAWSSSGALFDAGVVRVSVCAGFLLGGGQAGRARRKKPA